MNIAAALLAVVTFVTLAQAIPDDGQTFTKHHRILMMIALTNLAVLLLMGLDA